MIYCVIYHEMWAEVKAEIRSTPMRRPCTVNLPDVEAEGEVEGIGTA
jgi:hypothetical protein